jgi:hypothetical protein
LIRDSCIGAEDLILQWITGEEDYLNSGFEVLTSVSLKSTVFWFL